MDAFGIRVRYFRKRLKLSQDELAEKSDLHRTYIGAVERGERNISLMNIFRFGSKLIVGFSKFGIILSVIIELNSFVIFFPLLTF